MLRSGGCLVVADVAADGGAQRRTTTDHSAARYAAQAAAGVRVISVDWTAELSAVRRALPPAIGVQGNLDPVLMTTTPELVRREATRLLEAMRGTTGHIFNLGHGITPQAKIECMESLVATVTGWKN